MSEFSGKIKDFIMTQVRPELQLASLGDDEPLIDSGIIDSLGVLTILAHLDEAYGIDLSAEQITLENFKTVRTICELIDRLRPA
jgi:acyl carrier protein